jgi:excisionase family DNA binding protein
MTMYGVDEPMVAKRSEEPEDLLSVAETAELLRVSPSTVWRWINDARLPSFKIGEKRVRVRRKDALKLVVAKDHRDETAADDIRKYITPNLYADPDWRRAVEAARVFREKLLAENGGRLFSDSTDDINEAREERTTEL